MDDLDEKISHLVKIIRAYFDDIKLDQLNPNNYVFIEQKDEVKETIPDLLAINSHFHLNDPYEYLLDDSIR